MKQQQNSNREQPPDHGVNYVAMFLTYFALAPELLLHDPRTFGVRSIGPRAAGTVFSMYFFAMFYTYSNRTPLLLLTAAVAFLAIVGHISALIRERRGRLCHSRYNGTPWAMAILPMSEGRMKRTEPLFLVLSGWGLHHLNNPLGSFVITAGACHGLLTVLEYVEGRARTLDLNDALAEQTITMQSMKRMRRR